MQTPNYIACSLQAPMADTPLVDTAEMVYISSLALLKMLKHGRAGVPMEVMGLMLGVCCGCGSVCGSPAECVRVMRMCVRAYARVCVCVCVLSVRVHVHGSVYVCLFLCMCVCTIPLALLPLLTHAMVSPARALECMPTS